MVKNSLLFFLFIALALNAKSESKLSLINAFTFKHGEKFQGEVIGGLSGITFIDDLLYAVSDDRGSIGKPRIFIFENARSRLIPKQVTFIDNTFPRESIDPEGIAFDSKSKFLYLTSEGSKIIPPFIGKFSLDGKKKRIISLENEKFRKNKSLESLTISKDGNFLLTASERGKKGDKKNKPTIYLYQKIKNEFLFKEKYPYHLEKYPVAKNGLVELLFINNSEFLSLERAWNPILKINIVKLFKCKIIQKDKAILKEFVMDLAKASQIRDIDNIEGMAWGPVTKGNKTLFFVSDNNFSKKQVTHFLQFRIQGEL